MKSPKHDVMQFFMPKAAQTQKIVCIGIRPPTYQQDRCKAAAQLLVLSKAEQQAAVDAAYEEALRAVAETERELELARQRNQRSRDSHEITIRKANLRIRSRARI